MFYTEKKGYKHSLKENKKIVCFKIREKKDTKFTRIKF